MAIPGLLAAGSALDAPSYGDAHSLWFQLLATRGIAGLAACVLLVFAVARTLSTCWRDPIRGPGVTGPFLALAAFVTYSFVSVLFYLQAIQVLFWVIAALAAGGESVFTAPTTRVRWAVTLGCAVAMAVQLLVAQPLVAQASATLARQPRGFYPIERGPEGALMRWSSSSGALCLRPDAKRVQLRFAAIDPRVARLPRIVTLQLDGREIDRFDIKTIEVVTRVLDLPAAVSRSGPAVDFGECSSESRRLLPWRPFIRAHIPARFAITWDSFPFRLAGGPLAGLRGDCRQGRPVGAIPTNVHTGETVAGSDHDNPIFVVLVCALRLDVSKVYEGVECASLDRVRVLYRGREVPQLG